MEQNIKYVYCISLLTQDKFGLWRDGAYTEIEADEVPVDVGEFEGASDLPDNTKYADGTKNGRRVRVMRTVVAK